MNTKVFSWSWSSGGTCMLLRNTRPISFHISSNKWFVQNFPNNVSVCLSLQDIRNMDLFSIIKMHKCRVLGANFGEQGLALIDIHPTNHNKMFLILNLEANGTEYLICV